MKPGRRSARWLAGPDQNDLRMLDERKMKTMRRKSWTCAAAIAVLFLVATTLMAGPAPAANRWGANYFPNVALTTQDGKTVHFFDDLLKGDKKVVINFVYPECATCPNETAKLVEVQKILGNRMGKDVFFYSINVDPKKNTPDALKAYANKFNVGPGWLFLNGKKADVDAIRKKIGLESLALGPNPRGHSQTIVIGCAATGQWVLQDSTIDLHPETIATMVGDWLTGFKPPAGAATAVASVPDKGQYLFKTRCSNCHTVGKGDGIGPDLAGVTNARNHDWLARFIATPDEVLASGDPVATALFAKFKNVPCPNPHLGESDVHALIKFLEAQSSNVGAREGKGSQ
jgi:protein SCO1